MKLALLFGALVLAVVPAMALAAPSEKGAEKGKGSEKKADPTPGPKAGLPAKAKAYGRYCKEASRKKEEGEKQSEFARCVTRMARAANNERMAARKACRGLSKKHEPKGEKGTEFSRCVKGVAQLRREEKRQQRQEEREQKEEEEKAESEEP
jgi:hypothetical protein